MGASGIGTDGEDDRMGRTSTGCKHQQRGQPGNGHAQGMDRVHDGFLRGRRWPAPMKNAVCTALASLSAGPLIRSWGIEATHEDDVVRALALESTDVGCTVEVRH